MIENEEEKIETKETNNVEKSENDKKIENSDSAIKSENRKNGKREKKAKARIKLGPVRVLLLVIFVAIFIFSSVNLIRWAIFNKKSKDTLDDIIETTVSKEIEEDKNPINFEELKKINEDAVAWIKIDGTSINYPILQTVNNDYYLHKDINEKYSSCGWIFMDFRNSANFIDKNTVIYGHNIKSGLMFADLAKIQKNELGKDIKIEIYTPNEMLEYSIFSSYMTEPEDYAIKANITSENDMENYIKTMVSRSSILYNITPYKTDKVLTLSTCDSTGQKRILVHAVCTNSKNINY